MQLSKILDHNHNFSFKVGDKAIAICVRCSSIIIGLGLWLYAILVLTNLHIIVSNLRSFDVIVLGIILTLPLVILWLLQSYGKYHNFNWQRSLSGILFAAALVIFILRLDLALITVPIALVWQGSVLSIGYRARSRRKVDWNCKACTNELFKNI